MATNDGYVINEIISKLNDTDIQILDQQFGLNLRQHLDKQVSNSRAQAIDRVRQAEKKAMRRLGKLRGARLRCWFCDTAADERADLYQGTNGATICLPCAEAAVAKIPCNAHL